MPVIQLQQLDQQLVFLLYLRPSHPAIILKHISGLAEFRLQMFSACSSKVQRFPSPKSNGNASVTAFQVSIIPQCVDDPAFTFPLLKYDTYKDLCK